MDEEVKIEEKIPQGVEEAEKLSDDVYRLQEMADEMLKSIDNLKKVKEEQKYLIEVLSKVNDEKLKPLLNELSFQIKNIEAQIEKLTTKQILIAEVCAACEDFSIRTVVNNLLTGLGVFPQE